MKFFTLLYKNAVIILFLLIFIDANAQQKLIGFLNRGAYNGNGTAFTINTNGTSFQKNLQFPLSTGKGIDMVDGNDGFFYGSTLGNAFGDAGSIFQIKPNGTEYKIIRKFTRATDGGAIRYRPVVGPDGFLYGVCEDGGANNNGTIWKLSKDGATFTILRNLSNAGESTMGNFGSLILGVDGKLYGCLGGSNGHIIRMNTDGTNFSKLFSFTNVAGAYPGSGPQCPLLQGTDGNFYGVCVGGGSGNKGVAFKYNVTTSTYTLLKTFTDNDGAYPATTPVEGNDGYIISGCPNYGTLNGGTIWKVKKDGSAFTVLKQLDLSVTGNRPGRKFYIHTDGYVYGTMGGYGPNNSGSFFKIAQDGTGFNVIRSDFDGGLQAWALLYRELENKFYIVFGYGGPAYGLLSSLNSDGSSYKRIYSFDYESEGYAPVGTPAVSLNNASPQYGKAFGTTNSGGMYANGTLFSYRTGFAEQRVNTLRDFKPADGIAPAGRSLPILGSDNFVYGVIGYGGPVAGNTGTAYRVNPDDTTTFTIIKSFGNFGGSPTGCTVPGTIMEAADGYLYGNTTQAGTNNRGTIFKMQKDGSNYSNIYQFGGSNILLSGSSFIQDPATQKLIGIGTVSSNDAVIFSIDTDGSNPTIIKVFTDAAAAVDGRNIAGLTLQGDSLYGAATAGPTNYGLIFKLHKSGSGYATIKAFASSEGGTPYGNLQFGEDGYLYGTCGGTMSGSTGANIYKIKKDGTDYTVIKSFGLDMNSADGNAPGAIVLLPCVTPQNATDITFSSATTSSITLSGFSAPLSGGANGYVVKINTINSFTPPADGTLPTASTAYTGGEQVIYAGTSITPITVTGLAANTQYYFKVFAYGCTANLYSNANTNNNPAMLRTPPPGITSHANLMARFDGVNDYTNAGDVASLENNTAISFGGWVKPQSFPATNFNVKSFVAKSDFSASGTTLQAGFYKNDGSQLLVMAQLGIGVQLARVEIPVDSSMFRINQWSHFFVTWQSGEKLKLYINGRLVVQSIIPYTGTLNNTTAGLKFGSSDLGSSEENFHGDMEEMQFYNVALSQCEIRQRKHIILNGTEAGLAAYYQFNEHDGIPTFNDFMNNHNSLKQNGVLALTSDLSAGGGGSECISVQSTDYVYQLRASDLSNRLEMSFPVISPDGLMNGSYVEELPVGGVPGTGVSILPGYWVIDNFGNNQSNLNATLTFRFADGILTDGNASSYRLYKRPTNGSGVWEMYNITAVSLQPGNNIITVNGIPSFSQLVLTSTLGTLPLQLLSFNGSLVNTDATLQWHTTNEINVNHFDLERKLPGENTFKVITTTVAKNNGDNYYSFIDKKLPAGTTWYRLRITDKDGKITYSQIITVVNKVKAITVFPNPATDVLHVIYPEASGKTTAVILSADGRIVTANINILPNVNHININGLTKGTYILKCVDANGNATFTKFMKQ